MNSMLNAISTGGFPIQHLALDIQYLGRCGERLLRNLPLTQLLLYKIPYGFEHCTLSTKNPMAVELVKSVELQKDWKSNLLSSISPQNGRVVSARGEVKRIIGNLENKWGAGRVPAGWKAPSVVVRTLEIRQLRQLKKEEGYL
jgi:hypothetical protein